MKPATLMGFLAGCYFWWQLLSPKCCFRLSSKFSGATPASVGNSGNSTVCLAPKPSAAFFIRSLLRALVQKEVILVHWCQQRQALLRHHIFGILITICQIGFWHRYFLRWGCIRRQLVSCLYD
ncbi:hypothetical protein BD410DRAFT_640282 [Rickenella mellea]|uniref:Secreted protein n=1 Tax=Rickenella mellea TaxID=50990 RepID=A0A4Y7PPC3_9AGAM|nr:hypothetical protein BD410DRAFT_640282 [Rickenella mellea]